MQKVEWLRITTCTRQNNEHALEPKPRRKQHTVNICIIVTWRGKWIDECLEEAMDAINSVTTSFKHASRH